MLVQLAPAAARVRRLARDWRAGELSLGDYRRQRREIIDNFDAEQAVEARMLESTVPRFELEDTTRRPALAASPVRLVWRPYTSALMLMLLITVAVALPRWI